MNTPVALRVLTFKEGDIWVAQAIERDICVQAPDFDTLKERFEVVLELECQKSEERGDDSPLAGLTRAPDSFHEIWLQLESDRPIERFQVDGLDVEMASAA